MPGRASRSTCVVSLPDIQKRKSATDFGMTPTASVCFSGIDVERAGIRTRHHRLRKSLLPFAVLDTHGCVAQIDHYLDAARGGIRSAGWVGPSVRHHT